MGINYYYPKLFTRDFGWLRIGAPGLANCMFFAANAYIFACKSNHRGGTLLQLCASLV